MCETGDYNGESGMCEWTTEGPAECPAGDVLTNLGDSEQPNWQCVTPDNPTPAVVPAGGTTTYTAKAASTGSFDVCLADGVSTLGVEYSTTGRAAADPG